MDATTTKERKRRPSERPFPPSRHREEILALLRDPHYAESSDRATATSRQVGDASADAASPRFTNEA